MSEKLYLLSPASSSGRRAEILLNDRANFDLAIRIRSAEGATLGEVFSFLSGLYFRGKLAYARAFGTAHASQPGHLVITPTRGLMPSDSPVTAADLREFAAVPIDVTEPRYRRPLERDVQALASRLGPAAQIVLLGSIATDKYVEVIQAHFGERLLFPAAFVGRGDMSRGGLLLRAVDEGQQLEYLPVASAIRRGKRPPKLPKR
jgi:hypothetical protein